MQIAVIPFLPWTENQNAEKRPGSNLAFAVYIFYAMIKNYSHEEP